MSYYGYILLLDSYVQWESDVDLLAGPNFQAVTAARLDSSSSESSECASPALRSWNRIPRPAELAATITPKLRKTAVPPECHPTFLPQLRGQNRDTPVWATSRTAVTRTVCSDRARSCSVRLVNTGHLTLDLCCRHDCTTADLHGPYLSWSISGSTLGSSRTSLRNTGALLCMSSASAGNLPP